MFLAFYTDIESSRVEQQQQQQHHRSELGNSLEAEQEAIVNRLMCEPGSLAVNSGCRKKMR